MISLRKHDEKETVIAPAKGRNPRTPKKTPAGLGHEDPAQRQTTQTTDDATTSRRVTVTVANSRRGDGRRGAGTPGDVFLQSTKQSLKLRRSRVVGSSPPSRAKSNALATAAYSAERANVTHSADSVMAKKGGGFGGSRRGCSEGCGEGCGRAGFEE